MFEDLVRVNAVMRRVIDRLSVSEYEGLRGSMTRTQFLLHCVRDGTAFLDDNDVNFVVQYLHLRENVVADAARAAVLENEDRPRVGFSYELVETLKRVEIDKLNCHDLDCNAWKDFAIGDNICRGNDGNDQVNTNAKGHFARKCQYKIDGHKAPNSAKVF